MEREGKEAPTTMTALCGILGILCVAYFLLFAVRVRRLHSAQSWFWLLLAACFFAAAFVCHLAQSAALEAVLGALMLVGALGMGVQIRRIFSFAHKSRQALQELPATATPRWIMVLGAFVRPGRIPRALKARLDTAYGYWRHHPEAFLVVTGGQGPDEYDAEAHAMAAYLRSIGAPAQAIVEEDASTTTGENMRFSRQLIDERGGEGAGIVVVTNDFHLYRAVGLARQAGFQRVYALPAPSPLTTRPHFVVREVLALLQDKLRGRG